MTKTFTSARGTHVEKTRPNRITHLGKKKTMQQAAATTASEAANSEEEKAISLRHLTLFRPLSRL